MKKLLIFHPFLTTYRLDTYNYFTEKFDLKVILYYPDIKNLGFNKENLNKYANFDFLYLMKGISIGTQKINLGLIKWLVKFKPDIVMPHEFGFNAIAAILLRPILNYTIFITSDDSPKIAEDCKGFRQFLRTFCIKRIDGLILVNPKTIDILNEKYPLSNCRFFYYPIIQEEKNIQSKLARSIPIAENYLVQYNLKDKFIFLFVGRLVEVKGLDILIAAFSKVHKKNNHIRLILVGDGERKESLISLTRCFGLEDAIFFTGQKMEEELFAWYQLGQVFILPSRFEPFGAVVNEALVCGCKVIVSNQVGASCLVDNENGCVFKSENENELADFMQTSLTNVNRTDVFKQRKNRMNISFQTKTEELIDFINH